MKIFRSFNDLPDFRGAVATLGSFDGLHCGHISLLNHVKELAKESDSESVILTFEPHPRVILGRAEGLRLLTSTEEKILILEQLGIDNLIVIPFDKLFSRLSHQDFVKLFLVDKVKISSLVVGYNHHVGRGSEGSYESLLKMGMNWGFGVHRVDEWRDKDFHNVSSTVIRSLISNGDIEGANTLLSRPYTLLGQVDGDGRVWPNEPLKLLPPQGGYEGVVNGVQSIVTVDDSGVMMCDEYGAKVQIDIIAKIS